MRASDAFIMHWFLNYVFSETRSVICPFEIKVFFRDFGVTRPESPSGSRSDAGSGLRLLGVAGGRGSGLSGECVHCAEELICDASSFPEAA